jgi:hypothetical protein
MSFNSQYWYGPKTTYWVMKGELQPGFTERQNGKNLYISARPPEAFGGRVQRDFEVAFGSIANHLRER